MAGIATTESIRFDNLALGEHTQRLVRTAQQPEKKTRATCANTGSTRTRAPTLMILIHYPLNFHLKKPFPAKRIHSEQVDQIHTQHRSKMERLRDNNKAKANDFITNRMRQARQQQQDQGRGDEVEN